MRYFARNMLQPLLLFAMMTFATSGVTASVVDFEDLTPGTSYGGSGGGEYWNGSDNSGGFNSGGAYFNNSFTDWGGGSTSWDKWAYSNTTDITTAGFTNQYSAYTGGAHGGSNYGVYYEPWSLSPTITIGSDRTFSSAYVTNTTYPALAMLNGDSFSKKFGGPTGNDPDWFMLTITGRDLSNNVTGALDFYLADYRFADNGLDYIVDEWTSVDLTSLGNATQLEFDLSSSDVGAWGMNTPAYFAVDDITTSTAVPEPSSFVIFGAGGLLALAALRRRRRRSDRRRK